LTKLNSFSHYTRPNGRPSFPLFFIKYVSPFHFATSPGSRILNTSLVIFQSIPYHSHPHDIFSISYSHLPLYFSSPNLDLNLLGFSSNTALWQSFKELLDNSIDAVLAHRSSPLSLSYAIECQQQSPTHPPLALPPLNNHTPIHSHHLIDDEFGRNGHLSSQLFGENGSQINQLDSYQSSPTNHEPSISLPPQSTPKQGFSHSLPHSLPTTEPPPRPSNLIFSPLEHFIHAEVDIHCRFPTSFLTKQTQHQASKGPKRKKTLDKGQKPKQDVKQEVKREGSKHNPVDSIDNIEVL